MKKINLLMSTFMIALAILVAGLSVVPAYQAQAMALQTASNANGKLSGTALFDSKGRYAVQQSDLQVGGIFQFFGHDWYVVYVNEAQKVATFWMADPYADSIFDKTTAAANGINVNGSNVWSNGYTNAVWQSPNNNDSPVYLGESEIRKFLTEAAKTMLDDTTYEKYYNKVVNGYVDGTNEKDTEATEVTIGKLSYSHDSVDNVTEDEEPSNQIKANYSLGEQVRLWLPSVKEIEEIWKLHESMLGWTDNTISNRAWLRTPDLEESCYAMTVCSEKQGSNVDSYFATKAVGQTAGVRPAIHLNIEKIAEEYQAHSDEINDNGGSHNGVDDWLKILFIVVCVLGIVGVALVIIAVIIKSRKNNREEA